MDTFTSLLGQERIKKNMDELLKRDVLPHSLLFYGEKGLGKGEMAKLLASRIVGHPVFTSPLEEGLDIYIDRGDVFLLRPIKASGLKIQQWHTLLKEYLTKKSNGKRVVIIEEFQTARRDFMNALLKSIEEPPKGVYFILITTKKDSVLPTIISRCMLVPFIPLEREVIEEALIEKGYAHIAGDIAMLCQGNMARAMALIEEGEKETLHKAFSLLQLLGTDSMAFMNCIALLHDCSKEDFTKLLEAFRLLVRDIMALRSGAKYEDLYCPQLMKDLERISPYWSSHALEVLHRETLKAEKALHLNIRVALIVDGLLLTVLQNVKEK